ncbi:MULTISPECIES: hypothetical protein [unclassified Pedobacter]|nr:MULTISPECIES: hypothetical protein [unclassified Pedobacter]MCX2432814.1 hypothetical protein [Pedobacter sp. GR22-10]MCX2586088.1 hypothetical protein [Pedobacter sp. MR22-3]
MKKAKCNLGAKTVFVFKSRKKETNKPSTDTSITTSVLTTH